MLVYAGPTSRRASGRSRRSARSRSRWPTWCGRCPYPEMYPPDDAATTTRSRSARTMFVDAVDDGRLPRRSSGGSRHRRAQMRRGSAARARRRDGARPGRRDGVRPPRAADHGQRRRRLRRRRTRRPRTRPGSTASRTRSAQDDAGAYVNFLGDEGEERVARGLPGRDVGPAGRGQATLRPGQPVPPEPEHPAGGVGSSDSAHADDATHSGS